MMRIEADTGACCGSGNCVMTAPAVFDQDDRVAVVVVLLPQPPPELHDLVRRAADLCPAGAIKVVED